MCKGGKRGKKNKNIFECQKMRDNASVHNISQLCGMIQCFASFSVAKGYFMNQNKSLESKFFCIHTKIVCFLLPQLVMEFWQKKSNAQ